MGIILILIFFSLMSSISPSCKYLRFLSLSYSVCLFFSSINLVENTDGFDSLDPNGNITITWDFLSNNEDTYDVQVSIHNFQLIRNLDRPGWRLGWAWKSDEAIWKMWGAEALQQGNCSRFKGNNQPHCCEKKPVIIDLMPGAPYDLQATNCCKGGVLTSLTQGPTKSVAAFRMNFNKASDNNSENNMPESFTLGVPGYTCGKPIQVPPSRSTKNGRRWEQSLETWNVPCVYSQFRASPSPKCCVSLSAFYSSTIIPCPDCSCSCQSQPGAKCVKPGEKPTLLQLPIDTIEEPPKLVQCSAHMCPVRVHWHIKQSYKDYWRTKITITNLNFVKNYSQWNLVVEHPNLQNVTQIFSFNYKALKYKSVNDTGLFWGIQNYNDILLSNVHTEMLLHKDKGIFNFKEGWAFPRKIYFNGDECVMPPPNVYPRLPNSGHIVTAESSIVAIFLLSLLTMFF
ncbi:COBRA-like protein [Quillaja saponaria]|uniref:COBRA-like protein n=1 Tax=Quillaja saponaria TaxID=32244 RepID=A0AAD7VK41_QUISA|nr:COBRA-like protein [Quillaja saponaria]